MVKESRKIIDLLIFSNLFLSSAALSQILLTQYSFKVQIPWPIYPFVFLSTFCTYGFSIVNFEWKGIRSDGSPRQNFISKHYLALKIAILISGLFLIILSFFIKPRILILFFLEAILAFLYSHPFIKISSEKIGFRKIPGVKNVIISLLWAMSVVMVPLLSIEGDLIFANPRFYYFFLRAFLLLLILSLLFDYRDIKSDRIRNTKTLASLLGQRKTKWISIVLILVLMLIHYQFKYLLSPQEYWAFNASSLMTLFSIFLTKENKNDYFYMLWLDGLILVQYPLVILFSIGF